MAGTERPSFPRIFAYLGLVNVALWLGNPAVGIPNLPIQTLLKDGLHLDATAVSFFNFVVSLPMFVGFVFGFARDRWSPFGMRDRGYFMLFGALGAAVYLALSLAPPAYAPLVLGSLVLTAAYRFLGAAQFALQARIGQEDGMTGRLSALANLVGCALFGVAYILGGNNDAGDAGFASALAIGAGLTFLFVPLGAWRAKGVFTGGVDAPAQPAEPLRELGRLVRHRPFLLAVVLWLIFQFTPTLLTPLLFHFTRDLHAGADRYGMFMGIFFLSFVPISIVYALLCRVLSLRTILWWGAAALVPQTLPLLFLRDAEQAQWLAPLLALSGGFAQCAIYDLLLRACPKGLEGTGMMLADTAFWVSWKLGDVFGSWLYDRGGIAPTVWASTIVYACAFLVLPFIPRAVTDRVEEPVAA
jgi:hypothetical protein